MGAVRQAYTDASQRSRCKRLDFVPAQWYNACMKEYIAYKGEKYIIEWYFTAKGDSQPLQFYED